MEQRTAEAMSKLYRSTHWAIDVLFNVGTVLDCPRRKAELPESRYGNLKLMKMITVGNKDAGTTGAQEGTRLLSVILRSTPQ